MLKSAWGRILLMVAGALVVLALAGWWAFDRYFIYLPGMVQDIRNPIGPVQDVSWQPGPDEAPDT